MENKTQTRNIIIAVVIILIAASIFYFNSARNNTNDTPAIDNSTILNTDINNNDPTTTPTNENNTNDNIISTIPDTSKINKDKFNTAINSAATAFTKGDYAGAIKYYKLALTYNYEKDIAYSRLSSTYGAQGDWVAAQINIDSAIAINPLYVEYWTWKLTLLDEKTKTSFADLKKIYEDGLTKVDKRVKVDLVSRFAQIAESKGEKAEAINLWKYAQEIYPTNKTIYQNEIDRLQF